MFCVGVIGNIASGKTTVLSYFKKLGPHVISADQIARELTAKDEPAFEKVVQHFGKSILNDNFDLNRPLIKQIIFKNKDERIWLENLLHPLIQQKIKDTINSIKTSYCLIEIPLLPNLINYPYINRILWIKALEEAQIIRLMSRDSCTRQDALDILFTQAPESKHHAIANDILINNGTLESLQEKILALHYKYLTLSNKKT